MTNVATRSRSAGPTMFIEPTNRNTVLIGVAFLLGGLGLLAFAVILTVRPRGEHMTPATVAAIAVTGALLTAVGLMLIVMRQKLVIDRQAGLIGDLQPLIQPWAPRFRPIKSFHTVAILQPTPQSAECFLQVRGEGDVLAFAHQHSLPYSDARRIGRQIAAACKFRLIDESRQPPAEIPVTKWFDPLGLLLALDGESTEADPPTPGCRIRWTSAPNRDIFELPAVGFRWRHVWLTVASFAGLFTLILKLSGQRMPGDWPILEILVAVYVILILWTLISMALIRETLYMDAETLVIERREALSRRTWRLPLEELESIEVVDAAWRDRTLGPLRSTSVLAVHARTESCVLGVGLTESEQRYLHNCLEVTLARRYAGATEASDED